MSSDLRDLRDHRDHRANHLLAALPSDGFDLLAPRLETVALSPRAVLFEPGHPLEHVYFPLSGVVSLMVSTSDGAPEAAAIGPEGFVGMEAVLQGDRCTTRALVQLAGVASRIGVEDLQKAMRRCPPIGEWLRRYVRYFLVQTLQSVACNGLHRVEERFAKWLLLAQDRNGNGHSFNATQEFLAEMLGVHRPTVTIVARTLQSAGLIHYSRGVITVMDRKGLERAACDCYASVRRAMEEILSED